MKCLTLNLSKGLPLLFKKEKNKYSLGFDAKGNAIPNVNICRRHFSI
jgi:hypothetical protein